MDFLFLIAVLSGIVLLVVGFIGCVVPALPGPPFAFLALVILKFTAPNILTGDFLINIGIVTGIVYLLDYVLPLLGAKMYNASKLGIWGAAIGMIIGILFFPPLGMIFGLLIGAIAGELLSGKPQAEAIKIGFVSFVFSLITVLIKLVLVGVMAYYFVDAVVRYLSS